MKNLTFIFFIFLGITGCANFEFVYNKHPVLKDLENNTSVSISGDSSSVVISQFYQIFGTPSLGRKFQISANTSEQIKPTVYDADGTVSKQKITHIIFYTLRDTVDKCEILSKEISTNTTFDLASSGYNFGSDLSRQEITEQNIKKNIEGFFDYLVSYENDMVCPNENLS